MQSGRVKIIKLLSELPADWEASRSDWVPCAGPGTMGLDRSSDPQVFADLGLAPEQRLACFLYGGQPPGRWALRAECLPPGWACVVCAGGDPPGDAPLPHNFLLAPADAYTPDLARARAPMGCARVRAALGVRVHFCWKSVFARTSTRGGCIKHARWRTVPDEYPSRMCTYMHNQGHIGASHICTPCIPVPCSTL